jgi:hypothetical protein
MKLWRIQGPTVCRRDPCFLLGKYFGKIKIGQKKCPKTVLRKKSLRNTCFRCIIEIYGLAAKK